MDKSEFPIPVAGVQVSIIAKKLNDTAFSIDLSEWPSEKVFKLLLSFDSSTVLLSNPDFLLPETSEQFEKVLVTIKPQGDTVSF